MIGAFGTVTKELLKGLEDLGNWRTSKDYPNDSIIENVQNTEKSRGDVRRRAVTQTPGKNHQLTQDVKNSKGANNNNNNE